MTPTLEPRVGTVAITGFHRLVAAMVNQTVDTNGMFVVTAPTAGVGCSLSTWTATAQQPGVRQVWLNATPGWQPLHLHLEILTAAGMSLTGTRRNVVDATEDLADIHQYTPLVIVVDDAHLLTHDTLAHLTSLHRRISVPIGLVARPELTIERRRRDLLDRVDRWIGIDALPTDAMIPALRDHHPMYTTIADSELADIDRAWAKGRWRRWTQLTAALATYQPDHGPVTATALAHALTAVGGHRTPPPRTRGRR